MAKFKLVLPASEADDVDYGDLLVQVEGGDVINLVTDTPPTEVFDNRFTGDDDDSVHIELVYVDKAGNRSQARLQDVVIEIPGPGDTTPPPQPGEVQLVIIE